MPFKLKEYKDGYKVYNIEKKKYYSKKPIPLSNAKKQLTILRKYEKKENNT